MGHGAEMAGRLLDFGNIDLWRSEEMQLVQVRGAAGLVLRRCCDVPMSPGRSRRAQKRMQLIDLDSECYSDMGTALPSFGWSFGVGFRHADTKDEAASSAAQSVMVVQVCAVI